MATEIENYNESRPTIIRDKMIYYAFLDMLRSGGALKDAKKFIEGQ